MGERSRDKRTEQTKQTNPWVKNNRPLLELTRGRSLSSRVHLLPDCQPTINLKWLDC